MKNKDSREKINFLYERLFLLTPKSLKLDGVYNSRETFYPRSILETDKSEIGTDHNRYTIRYKNQTGSFKNNYTESQ